jgi:hypothetical protein
MQLDLILMESDRNLPYLWPLPCCRSERDTRLSPIFPFATARPSTTKMAITR